MVEVAGVGPVVDCVVAADDVGLDPTADLVVAEAVVIAFVDLSVAIEISFVEIESTCVVAVEVS